jgi:hypothetical protein
MPERPFCASRAIKAKCLRTSSILSYAKTTRLQQSPQDLGPPALGNDDNTDPNRSQWAKVT